MRRLEKGKYYNVKKSQELKKTNKRVKFSEGINTEIPPPMESEGEKN